ncbi:MAG: RuvX/YqgF family protein, partial [Planctomycetales bacterium]|nr:RuvX/YqgF family protein [Planctomycetales bacterium]
MALPNLGNYPYQGGRLSASKRFAVTNSQEIPRCGRLIGIDYGSVRIGLSVSDESQTWVTPLETYSRKDNNRDAQYFQMLLKKHDAVGWVVGLPIHCDGTESQKSKEVRKFAEWLSTLS